MTLGSLFRWQPDNFQRNSCYVFPATGDLELHDKAVKTGAFKRQALEFGCHPMLWSRFEVNIVFKRFQYSNYLKV